MGADNTLDYLAVPAACKVVKAFPDLGWRDAPSSLPGQKAAPALQLGLVICLGANCDPSAAGIQTLLSASELVSMFGLRCLGRFADELDALKALDRVFHLSDDWEDAYEAALSRATNPSTFQVTPADLETPSTFLQGGAAAIPAQAGRAAVAARSSRPSAQE